MQWGFIECDQGALTSVSNPPYQTWNDSGANAAFDDAIQEWEVEGRSLLLTNHLANYFHVCLARKSCPYVGGKSRLQVTDTINQHHRPGQVQTAKQSLQHPAKVRLSYIRRRGHFTEQEAAPLQCPDASAPAGNVIMNSLAV